MKIVFCASEVFPFAKTGGLADVTGTLPLALESLGHEVSIFMPCYPGVDTRNCQLFDTQSGKVAKTRIGEKTDIYFLINDEYFYRNGVYGDEKGDFPDNLERFQYFCDEFLQALKFLKIKADIIHCHDWQTALVPVYLKRKYQDDPFFRSTKTLLTIHNLAFQGLFAEGKFPVLQLDEKLYRHDYFEFFGKINLLKAGIIDSDGINTVSPRYAQEIQTKEFGCGLDDVLKSRGAEVVGILNGLDYQVWDPARDHLIAQQFSADDFLEKKKANKKALQDLFGLRVDENLPIFGFVGRLAHQKGLDILIEALNSLAPLPFEVIIQGVGSGEYKNALEKLMKSHSDHVALCFEFDEQKAHQIYAGCDFFLMPSQFEPCGLSQMISLAYGTIPIGSKTGGLVDTIKPFNRTFSEGNGFLFSNNSAPGLVAAIKEASDLFYQKELMVKCVQNTFLHRFTWEDSAKEYEKEYKCLLSD